VKIATSELIRKLADFGNSYVVTLAPAAFGKIRKFDKYIHRSKEKVKLLLK
jgi:hypothetical protein